MMQHLKITTKTDTDNKSLNDFKKVMHEVLNSLLLIGDN